MKNLTLEELEYILQINNPPQQDLYLKEILLEIISNLYENKNELGQEVFEKLLNKFIKLVKHKKYSILIKFNSSIKKIIFSINNSIEQGKQFNKKLDELNEFI